MKKLVLAFLMMTSMAIPTFAAEPSLFDKMDNCTYDALKQTEYSMLAAATPDDKQLDFEKFIAGEAVANPGAKHLIIMMGATAWVNRKNDPVDVGYSAYKQCLRETGTAT